MIHTKISHPFHLAFSHQQTSDYKWTIHGQVIHMDILSKTQTIGNIYMVEYVHLHFVCCEGWQTYAHLLCLVTMLQKIVWSIPQNYDVRLPLVYFLNLIQLMALTWNSKNLKLVSKTNHFKSKFPNNLGVGSSKSNASFRRQALLHDYISLSSFGVS